MSDRIEIKGAQFMTRKTADAESPLHQVVKAALDLSSASIEVTGSESGQMLSVVSDDPAVIEYLKRVDHIQMVVSLSNRPPVPEPIRLPAIGGPGQRARQCWLCEGRGEVEDREGWQECASCHGAGLLPLVVPEE